MKCVKGLGFLWVAVLAAFFALSACEDSSSASSDETGTSSSSVETSDLDESSSSVDKNSSGNESTEKDKSSSSVKGSEPAEVSSSSAKETKNSSDSKSSSSVKTDDSSSSNKDMYSSSEMQSSSSSVKRSSSSVAKSSSSGEYVPFDHSLTLAGAYKVGEDAYHQFTDKRNGRSYYYITITGKDTSGNAASVTVMAENLNIGVDVLGTQDQTDDEVIERYCYNDDTTNCDRYGGLYQWAEMMQLPSECNNMDCSDRYDPTNHQGICPDNWRLLTYDDFYIILNANTNDSGIKGLRSTYDFGGNNKSGFSLVGAGGRDTWGGGGFLQLNVATYWYYPKEFIVDGQMLPAAGFTYINSQDKGNKDSYADSKEYGYSVRCVKVEN
ncbi:FISUMP domain-containing protein [uncultured Fibrobacter sp.]|uniref:FISUMP domain-containing protein n=1 Tax=uncultured Fibrobacter sp. TaxID=261512 RepID=UPI0025E9D04D|nr:FISUMP domain-containing protein [uncultured Fibrobacter sp.]